MPNSAADGTAEKSTNLWELQPATIAACSEIALQLKSVSSGVCGWHSRVLADRTTHCNRVLIAFAQLFIAVVGMRQRLCHENFAAVHTQHTAKSAGRTLIDFLAKLCKL